MAVVEGTLPRANQEDTEGILTMLQKILFKLKVLDDRLERIGNRSGRYGNGSSGSLDGKFEDTMVEDQNGKLDVMESADVQVRNVEKFDDSGVVSKEGMNTMQENLSMEETNTVKSDITGEIHDDAIPTTAEPSEDGIILRSGIIFCNVLNKVRPAIVPKVVEGLCDSASISDGATLSVYQYFKNGRNFLVSMEELGVSTFAASDWEPGGKTTRIVNCIPALKAYNDWKQGGGSGPWKFSGGSLMPNTFGKYFIWKTLDLFMNSFSRASSANEKFLENLSGKQCLQNDTRSDSNAIGLAGSLNVILADEKQEEIPLIVESLLSEVMEEFQHRLASQIESIQLKSQVNATSEHVKVDRKNEEKARPGKDSNRKGKRNENIDVLPLHRKSVGKQHEDFGELRQTVRTAKAGTLLLQMQCMDKFGIIGQHLQGLSQDTSGYQKVLEENRRLYNEVKNLKGNIRVYCRVRPCIGGSENRQSFVKRVEEGNIVINIYLPYGKEARKLFTFNKVFGYTASQAEVFSDTQPFVRYVLDGYKACIGDFKKEQLKILAHVSDRNQGGRGFDEVLSLDFTASLKEQYKIKVNQNARACLRLRGTCEKMKKVLNTNLMPGMISVILYRPGTFPVDVQNTDSVKLPGSAKNNTNTIGSIQYHAESTKVEVKVRLNLHGIVAVESAKLMEEEEVEILVTKEDADKMEIEDNLDAVTASSGDGKVNMQDAKGTAIAGYDTVNVDNGVLNSVNKPVQMEAETKVEVPKKKTKEISLPVNELIYGGLSKRDPQAAVKKKRLLAGLDNGRN